jgi:very-short-patch-repair endonuclease
MRIYNKLETKEFRKSLRKNLTPQERKLWNVVRNRKILNLKFFRQYGIGRFTADFYCPEIRLAIEADGGQHNAKQGSASDSKRTQYFESLKIKILRFWNNEIDSNLEGVHQKILATVVKLKRTHPFPLFELH